MIKIKPLKEKCLINICSLPRINTAYWKPNLDEEAICYYPVKLFSNLDFNDLQIGDKFRYVELSSNDLYQDIYNEYYKELFNATYGNFIKEIKIALANESQTCYDTIKDYLPKDIILTNSKIRLNNFKTFNYPYINRCKIILNYTYYNRKNITLDSPLFFNNTIIDIIINNPYILNVQGYAVYVRNSCSLSNCNFSVKHLLTKNLYCDKNVILNREIECDDAQINGSFVKLQKLKTHKLRLFGDDLHKDHYIINLKCDSALLQNINKIKITNLIDCKSIVFDSVKQCDVENCIFNEEDDKKLKYPPDIQIKNYINNTSKPIYIAFSYSILEDYLLIVKPGKNNIEKRKNIS